MKKKINHHRYPLNPDVTLNTTFGKKGELLLNDNSLSLNASDYSWLLKVYYSANKYWKIPGIAIYESAEKCFTQYLERGETGYRWLNLSGIDALNNITLSAQNCQLEKTAQLQGFKRPQLNSGPIVIIAPHPDDAELAAFGLYQRLAKHAWIITLTAGERQKRLEKQYWPNLDDNHALASYRKGWIRAWNSATTPLLAGIPQERLIQLGYFNDTLSQLVKYPNDIFSQSVHARLTPSAFRCWNHYRLNSDSYANNSGQLLIGDLVQLFNDIRPTTLVVTHPEVDPHTDHIAAAKACALALKQSRHIPEQVLLYANHLRKERGFPRGPAHAGTGLWPLNWKNSQLGSWRFYSEKLSMETQRQKAIAMDTMHDLRARPSIEKRLKRYLKRYLSGISSHDFVDYGQHDYFQTHIKAHESFVMISGEAFRDSLD